MGGLLKYIRFKDFSNWSVKYHLSSLIASKYKIVELKKYIQEEKQKIKPFEFPEEDFKILGVNNKIGLFDNEIKKGKEINQPYKIVKDGFLAYNPYRINVGSIGLKTKEQKYDLISPAYVVFSCHEELLSEYLFLVFKTKTFNNIINESTRGSVRQILAFDILENLKIPLPTMEKQKEIVASIEKYERILKDLEIEHRQLLEEFNHNIFPSSERKIELLEFVNYSKLSNWSASQYLTQILQYNENYPLTAIGNFLSRNKTLVNLNDNNKYKRVTIKLYNKGVFVRDVVYGREIKTKKQYLVKEGQFLISKIDARNGAFGLATKEVDGAIITADFFAYDVDTDVVNPFFLSLVTTTNQFMNYAQSASSGTTGRQRINEQKFLEALVPLPTLDIQKELIKELQTNLALQKEAQKNKELALQEFEKEIFDEA